MSDGWRRKKYYNPRVLIRTAHILDCPFPDSLVCLTGAEQALLRNLTQYLHRRSTFASECHQNHYLAPSNEQWNALEAIVVELEDKLMGCTELTDLLTAIKAATQCTCEQLTAMAKEAWPAGGTLPEQPDYDDYTSPVYADEGDPPGEFPTWDDWHDYVCIAAQHVFHEQTDLMNKLEVWYSAGAAITFALFQTLVLGTAIVPPVALALTIVGILAVAGTALSVIAVRDWIEEHMHDLVCAVFAARNVDEALAGISVVVEETWNLFMSRAFFETIVNRKVLSAIFDGTVPDYASWEGAYDPSYCADCEFPIDPYHATWSFPPCPRAWTLANGAWCDGNGNLNVAGKNDYAYSPEWSGIDAGTYGVKITTYHKGNRPDSYDNGQILLERDVGAGWILNKLMNLKSTGDGVWHSTESSITNFSIQPADKWRIYIKAHTTSEGNTCTFGSLLIDFGDPV